MHRSKKNIQLMLTWATFHRSRILDLELAYGLCDSNQYYVWIYYIVIIIYLNTLSHYFVLS